MTVELAPIAFATDTTAAVVWDDDHARTQRRFLSAINSDYFRYLARVHGAELDSENGLESGVALRIAYSHALETMYALIAAALQAPECPAGWIQRYRTAELDSIVAKISKGGRVLSRVHLDRWGWLGVSKALIPWNPGSSEADELRVASGRLWGRMAKHLTDRSYADEYNSLKHGFRVRSGGWYFRLGAEDTPGVPAPPERMRTLANSDHGSTYLRAINVKKHQWQLEEQSVNWDPALLAQRLALIAASIDNVVAFLNMASGLPLQDVTFEAFDEATVEAVMTEHHLGTVHSVRMNHLNIDPAWLPNLRACLRRGKGGRIQAV